MPPTSSITSADEGGRRLSSSKSHHGDPVETTRGKHASPTAEDDDESGNDDSGDEAAAVTPVRSTLKDTKDPPRDQGQATPSPVVESDPPLQPSRKLSVFALIKSFSPRSRAKAKAVEESQLQPRQQRQRAESTATTTLNTLTTTFGKLKRSSLNGTSPTSSPPATAKPSSPTTLAKWQHAAHTVARDANRLRVEIPPPPLPPVASTSSSPPAERKNAPDKFTADDAFTSGPGSFVDDVRTTLSKLLITLDAIDPRKLVAIRLGGELRGLLGKAQDEFEAYAASFQDHVGKVGVAIALQNFAASLHQVFPIVERLQTTKFMLNRQFKRDVTFAFQEINSYYTSMFMELSMAVAQSAGVPVKMPSPMNPALTEPVVDQDEPDDTVKAPSAAEICINAHQHYFGHARAVDIPQAIELYKHAAELKDPVSMTCLGHIYMNGIGVASDLFLAETWLTRAAAESGGGDPEVFYLLGCLMADQAPHQKTEALENDRRRRAKVYWTMAAERGHREAQYRLAEAIEAALGDESSSSAVTGSEDTSAAIAWYRRAADQRHIKAQSALGRLLLYGYDTKTNSDATEAIHWLQQAAMPPSPADADATALTLLGLVYLTGRAGVKCDVERSRAFLQKAVDKGSHEAMLHLARLMLQSCTAAKTSATAVSLDDRESTHDEAFRLLLNAAHGGSIEALYEIGDLLYSSAWLRDRAAALRYFIKAATSTPAHPRAAKRAATMFYSGTSGTSVNKVKAHEFYSIAADAGDPDALNSLGLMFEDGDGCDLDYVRAADCYRRAVAKGSAHAHFNLGCLLAHGKGVPRNPDAAQNHFQHALAMGYELAHDFLPSGYGSG